MHDDPWKQFYAQVRESVDFIAYVENGGREVKGSRQRTTLCPFHADTNPSCVLYPDHYYCYSCGAHGDVFDWMMKVENMDRKEAVRVAAELAGIEPPNHGGGGSNIPPNGTGGWDGLTLEAYAEAKQLPVPFLRSLGLSTCTYMNAPAIRIPYLDQSGVEVSIRFRVALTGKDGFRWRRESKPHLYGLWRLQEAIQAGYVIIVEGESDCHTLWYHDIPAVGVPGVSNWNPERDTPLLDGIEVIYAVIEPGDGGATLLERLLR